MHEWKRKTSQELNLHTPVLPPKAAWWLSLHNTPDSDCWICFRIIFNLALIPSHSVPHVELHSWLRIWTSRVRDPRLHQSSGGNHETINFHWKLVETSRPAWFVAFRHWTGVTNEGSVCHSSSLGLRWPDLEPGVNCIRKACLWELAAWPSVLFPFGSCLQAAV